MKKICANCKYNICERNSRNDTQFYCDNEDGEYFGVPTAYDDSCDDYEEKER